MKKIEDTDKKLFGEYAIAVSGFGKEDRNKILSVVQQHFEDMKVIFVDKDTMSDRLFEIFKKEHAYGLDKESGGKKAVIMSGFLEKNIVPFMKMFKTYGLSPELWAVLTQTSDGWRFEDLLKELELEAKEIKKAQKKKQNT